MLLHSPANRVTRMILGVVSCCGQHGGTRNRPRRWVFLLAIDSTDARTGCSPLCYRELDSAVAGGGPSPRPDMMEGAINLSAQITACKKRHSLAGRRQKIAVLKKSTFQYHTSPHITDEFELRHHTGLPQQQNASKSRLNVYSTR